MTNHHHSYLVCACLLASALHSTAVAAQSAPAASATANDQVAMIQHVPLNAVFAGEAQLAFETTSADRMGKIVVCVIADQPPRNKLEVLAERQGAGYVAVVPRAAVALPGFSYYVVERMQDGSERPVFAEARSPHHVRVARTEDDELEHERLQARGGRRSVVSLAAEGVDYGDRRLAAAEPTVHDRYYRLEVGYAHSFFRAIEDVRLSLVRVRGEAALYDLDSTPHSHAFSPGIDYGRAAVTLAARINLRFRGALLLGASQRGFEYGGAAAIILGDPFATSIDFGTETLTTLGTTTHLRLGFLAADRVPMGAALEVSSFPVGEDAGVRLLYDVGYRFDPVTTLTLRGGYQARTSISGGASVGVSFDYGF